MKKRHQLNRVLALLLIIATAPALAQNAASWSTLEFYGNLETGGVTATIIGDANANAEVSLQWRRVGESSFHVGQPLVRVDATHLIGSLFGLVPNTAYEVSATLSDVDGIGGVATRVASCTTTRSTRPRLRLTQCICWIRE